METKRRLITAFRFVSLILLFISNVQADTTFYEVWRNTEPDLSTAKVIKQWHQEPNYFDDDPSLVPNTNYYYWVRSLKGSIASHSETFPDGDSTGELHFWYASEASEVAVPFDSHGWPYKCKLMVF